MSTLRANEDHLDDVNDFLARRRALQHLKARRRGDAIILESDSDPRARLRRVSVSRWTLDMPDHRGRWEPTPYVDTLEQLLRQLVKDFPWTLAPTDQ